MTAPQPFQPSAPTAVHENVQLYLQELHSHPDRATLVYHRGEFYRWKGTHWERTDRETLTAWVYQLFEDTWYTGAAGPMPFNVNHVKAKAIVDGLQDKLLIDQAIEIPCWLQDSTSVEIPGYPAKEIIACQNVLVRAETRQQLMHTPRFYSHYSMNYDYTPSAPVPERWMQFLHQVWPDDPDSVSTLQEIFGYLLTYRTDLQTMFMMIGPPRCGKGTVVRVLTALLGGDHNVGSVSLADLNQRFGLEGIASKALAVMQDSRFKSRDEGVAVERLLSITGEDPVSVDKKNKSMYTARLPVRFMLVSNEIPKMQDESGALRTRMLMLKFVNEIPPAMRDEQLTQKLLTELPGILNWALDGLDRLRARRRFEQPKSAAEGLDMLAALSSPTKVFIEDMCRIGPMEEAVKADVFRIYKTWCERMNIRPKDFVHFGRDLASVVPGLDGTQRAAADANGKRPTIYRGLGLNTEAQGMLNQQLPWP